MALLVLNLVPKLGEPDVEFFTNSPISAFYTVNLIHLINLRLYAIPS